MLPDDPRHGTNAGYIAHALEDRDYCQPCRDAHRTYKKTIVYKKHIGLLPQHLKVPKTGTVRRVEALLALGHTHADIARAAGATQYISKNAVISRYDLVHVSVAEAVKVAYDKLSMVAPTGWRADESRRRALAHGYVPPLAWDDDTIDDPNFTPDRTKMNTPKDEIDPVVVQRFLDGDTSLQTTRAERFAIVARWLREGRSTYALEQKTNWKIERYITREGNAA